MFSSDAGRQVCEPGFENHCSEAKCFPAIMKIWEIISYLVPFRGLWQLSCPKEFTEQNAPDGFSLASPDPPPATHPTNPLPCSGPWKAALGGRRQQVPSPSGCQLGTTNGGSHLRRIEQMGHLSASCLPARALQGY